MKSAYLFAAILAPACFFAQPLDHGEEGISKPEFAREILGKRSPQTSDDNNGVGNAISPFNDLNNTDADNPQPDSPSDPNTNTNIGKRQIPAGDGKDSGIKINTYASAHCEGPSNNMQLIYDVPIAHQLQSYSLDKALGSDDVLAAFADWKWYLDSFQSVKPSLDGNPNAACNLFAYNLTGPWGTKGCHTLNNTVGCIIIALEEDIGI
ncbi:hypothetical protein BDR22DRAFT_976497 [Usnea florida]